MKRFLPCILIIVAVGLFALSPFGAEKVLAGSDGGWNFSILPSPKNLVLGLFAELGNFVLWVSSIVLWVAAMIFDLAVTVSVKDFAKYASMPGITDGWMIARDVMNLVFIFILLFISIATILQLSGYDTKKLLTSVILVALLVNFSAVATRVVIDASNILALEFYNAITPPSINGQPATLSGVFVSGLKLSTVYKAYDKNQIGPDAAVKDQFSAAGVIMGTFGGSALILVTAFVLFAGAILFIYRTVALLFLIVLSPIAFTAMAFPGMGSHAEKWRKELFNQSFFAPAFLFMIYLVAKMITSGELASKTGMGEKDGVLDSLFGGSVETMVYFVILIGFMLGSLIVAKSMGAHGASMVEGWGKTLKKKGQGYAGRIGKRTVGYVPEKILDEKSAIGKTWIGSVGRGTPLLNSGLAKVSSLRQRAVKDKEKLMKKEYGTYSNAGLKTLSTNAIITKAKKKVIDEIIRERGEFLAKIDRKQKLIKIEEDETLGVLDRVRATKSITQMDTEDALVSAQSEVEAEKEKSSGASAKPAEPKKE